MTETLQLGPLVLSLPLLLGAAAFIAATFVGRRLGGDAAAGVEKHLLRALLLGLLGARLAFVAQFREPYLAAPLDILDIRDGGWRPLVGAAVALAYVAIVMARRGAPRKALGAALATGAGLWIAGALALWAAAPGDQRMPRLELLAMDGRSVALSSFQGRPTVVNLWATWCPPCRREMPVLGKAQASHGGINFVFVNQGEPPQRVAAYLQGSGLELRNVLLDPRGEVATALARRALPTTLFFDAQGRLVDSRVGELSEATLAERLAVIARGG